MTLCQKNIKTNFFAWSVQNIDNAWDEVSILNCGLIYQTKLLDQMELGSSVPCGTKMVVNSNTLHKAPIDTSRYVRRQI